MSVRAKFICQAKDGSPGTSEEGTVTLRAVTQSDSDEEDFFRYTPWGEIKLGILNASAFAQFEVGKQYYVDFSPIQGMERPQ